jgi:prolyl oligopeptidase
MRFALLSCFTLAAALPTCARADSLTPPPPTRVDDFREVLHGVTLPDPYRWLEDQGSSEVHAWTAAQNRYAHSLLDPLPGRGAIRARLEALAHCDRQRAPQRFGTRYFTFKQRSSDELFILYVRDRLSGRDEVLLDPHSLSTDHTTDITLEDVAADGHRLVYGVRRGGEDETELRVLDVASKRDLPDQLPHARYRGVSLRPDGAGFYYALQDPATGIRIRYHAVGTPVAKDVDVFGGYGPQVWVSAEVSENGRHLLLRVSHGWARSDIFVQDLTRTGAPIVSIVKDVTAHFEPLFAGDRLFLRTDWNSPKGRVVEVDLGHPEPARWRECVPAGADAILGVYGVGGRLVVRTLHNVLSRLAIYTLDGKREGDLPMPGSVAVSEVNGRFDGDDLFFTFESYIMPLGIQRADVKTRTVQPWWRSDAPFDSGAYEMKQVWYPSKDGTRIPMFVMHKKGLVLDGSAPALLYGYGGFNRSLLPFFSSTAAWWLEQGGVFAVPNLRGGSEFGEEWHRGGMLANKQNVFDDFAAAARWLITNGYTRAERLAIRGGSNGGLLVGASLTQHPELFRAVLCEYPELDLVGFYRFPGNNPPALLEYGDARKPDQFKFLLSWSPYQNVVKGTKYPAVLLITGDEDTRVPPLQARKMTARLQSATASGRPVVLLYDARSGHAGGRPISRALDDGALELSFLVWQLGMTPPVAKAAQ